MSMRTKGNVNRKQVIRYLESHGWKTGIVERTHKWASPKDLFGLFDLVAIHPTDGVVFVQVSTGQAKPPQAYLDFARSYTVEGDERLHVVQYVKRNGVWTALHYKANGTISKAKVPI